MKVNTFVTKEIQLISPSLEIQFLVMNPLKTSRKPKFFQENK